MATGLITKIEMTRHEPLFTNKIFTRENKRKDLPKTTMKIWDTHHECMDRNDLEVLQLKRLQQTLSTMYERVAPYRCKMDALGIKPQDIKTLADLQHLPFMAKDDLLQAYPFGLFAVPQNEIVRLHASSGTTARSIVVGYTANDLSLWAELIARIVTMVGVGADDTAQIAFNYGLFTGGFGLHYGLERVGATVVPVSGGNTERQLLLMQDFGTTTLISTPSYALYLAETAAQKGLDLAKMPLRVGLFGGEPWTEEMRTEIEARLGILATDNYGLTEVIGPGVAGECMYKCGHHIAEDHFIVETIDPNTKKVLPPGTAGELVITSLSKEACPVIRFRTKDISRVITEPCTCGRTTARIQKITGRTDDMLIIRGVNVFPSQIESVLMGMTEIAPYYQINIYKRQHLDDLEILVEPASENLLEPYSLLEELQRTLAEKLRATLSIHARVRIVQPGTLERTAGKSKRVHDHR